MSASNSESAHDVIDDGAVSSQQFLVIGLCLFFNMLDGFDITAMAVVANSVSTELTLTPDRLGWIFSFALAGMMAGAMFLAPLSDVIGRRKLIIAAMALVGVSIVMTAMATTFIEFILLRFLSGLGAGAMLASQAALASEYSPEKYKALSVALVTSGYPLGAMMTSVIAAYVLPDFGWRGMFWFGGVLTLTMVGVGLLLLPESLKYLYERRPPNALARINAILRKLNKREMAALPAIERGSSSRSNGFLQGMLRLLRHEHRSTTLTLWLAFFLCFTTLYFLMSWIPKLMEDSGFTPEVGRQAFLLFNLGGVVGIYLVGWASTRLTLTNVICAMTIAAAVIMIVFAFAPRELNLLLGLTLLIGILQQGGFTGLYAAAAKAYPTEIRSTGIGWAIGLGRFGAVVGPTVAGYLIAAGLDMSANYIVFAVPLALGGLIAYRLHIR